MSPQTPWYYLLHFRDSVPRNKLSPFYCLLQQKYKHAPVKLTMSFVLINSRAISKSPKRFNRKPEYRLNVSALLSPVKTPMKIIKKDMNWHLQKKKTWCIKFSTQFPLNALSVKIDWTANYCTLYQASEPEAKDVYSPAPHKKGRLSNWLPLCTPNPRIKWLDSVEKKQTLCSEVPRVLSSA